MNEIEKINWLYNKEKIIEIVLRFARALDARDWKTLRRCLADEIFVDYSDFRGDAPRVVPADEFVRLRAEALSELKTQHISANHLVEIQGGGGGTCISNFLIHRSCDDGRFLDTAGHYIHGLRLEGNLWIIERIEQKVLWSRGDKQIHGAFRK